MAMSVRDVSPLRVDQNGTISIPHKEANIEGCSAAESIVCASKKLQDDLHLFGRNIKDHEDNMRLLKNQKNNLEDSILDKQSVLRQYLSCSQPTDENHNLPQSQNEDETTEQILRHEQSAAGIFCQMKAQDSSQISQHTLVKDVLGIVAALGKLDDDKLSRLFSEYLGVETMLAIVCKTYEGVKALEAYDNEGSINKLSGIHGFGACIGKNLDGRFLVICLENLRPYCGDFVPDDPQRRLNLLKPRLPNGECPPGFLGFAVNMINVETSNLFYVTESGFGLRETLFYHLFSRLQVYRTRAEMNNAFPCISDGALSLDGGMIKTTGVISLGNQREVDVKFGVNSTIPNLPLDYFDKDDEIKTMKWKRGKLIDDIKREQALLDHARFSFELKKQEFVKFLAESSSYMNNPNPSPGGRDRPIPR